MRGRCGVGGVISFHWPGSFLCKEFLAKNVVFFFCALLVTEFDLEPLNDDSFQLHPWRYGLGTARTKYPVPIRIRGRTVKEAI